MMSRLMLVRAILCLLCLAAKCGGSNESSSSQSSTVKPGILGKSDTVYHLDFAHREVAQTIDAAIVRAGPYKFVEVEVTRVVNPRKRSLVFDASYRPAIGEAAHLGSFTLYPPDNPGKFLVPVAMRLQAGGALRLSLSSPDTWTREDTIEVDISGLRLIP